MAAVTLTLSAVPHTVRSEPANKVGPFEKVINTSSNTAPHIPFPVVVKRKLTEPLLLSVAEGIYFADKVLSLGLKLPPVAPPTTDHLPPVAMVTIPFNCT